MDPLSNCFNKHSFEELNNIDFEILKNAFNAYISKNPLASATGVFFDVGTNAGSFIKVLQSFNITKNIHCFEPHPVLSEKVLSVYPFVRMNKLCLSNNNDETTIYMPELSCGLSSMIKRPVFSALAREGQKVVEYKSQCKKLDDYCAENGIETIDFIKLDVEGAEKRIFEGATRMLRENRINAGFFEVGQTSIEAGTSESELVSLITSYGYKTTKAYSRSDVYFFKE